GAKKNHTFYIVCQSLSELWDNQTTKINLSIAITSDIRIVRISPNPLYTTSLQGKILNVTTNLKTGICYLNATAQGAPSSQGIPFATNAQPNRPNLLLHRTPLALSLPGPGNYTFPITCYNTAVTVGEKKDTKNFTIVFDNTPPSIVRIIGNMTYEDPLQVTLDEVGNLSQISIRRQGPGAVQVYDLKVTSTVPHTTFTLNLANESLIHKIPQGLYTLSFTASDLAGNKRTFTNAYTFLHVLKPFRINLTKPSYGWSAHVVFPIEITSTRPLTSTACRYTNNPDLNYEQMQYTMVQGSTPFVFSSAEQINITAFGRTLKVGCKDTYTNVTVIQFFTLTYYPYPASITSAVFDPQPIIEYPLASTLTVVTNVSSVCRYDLSPKSSFSAYTYAMPGITNTHVQLINKTTFPGIDDFTGAKKNHTFYIVCQSLSELWDNQTTKINLSIAITSDIKIRSVSPNPLYTTSLQGKVVNVTTNLKTGICYLNATSPGTPFATNAQPNRPNLLLHSTPLSFTLPTDGIYTIPITCYNYAVAIGQKKDTASLKIYYDRTPPVVASVSLPSVLCYTNRVPVNVEASDNISSIVAYNYSLYRQQGNVLLVPWQTASTDDFTIRKFANGTSLTLVPGERYYVKVKAKNSVGLWSAEVQSNASVLNPQDTSCISRVCGNGICQQGETCQTCPRDCCPAGTGGKCFNNVFDPETESDKDCGKSCEPCGLGKKCTTNADCESYFCAQNDVGQKVCQVNHCSNSILDAGKETDVDCGKNCPACGEGKACTQKSDCAGLLFCHPTTKVCRQPSCSDGLLNEGTETDVDCGGICIEQGKFCQIGNKCSSHDDCSSKSCIGGICTAPSCTDGVRNGNETAKDCGGYCAALGYKCAVGESCLRDADCVSSAKCINRVCKSAEDATLDSDNDGIPDWWELKYGLNPFDPSDGLKDADADGLTNLEEYKRDLNPKQKDTDGDGFTDLEEIKAGTDPKDPLSFPKKSSWLGILLFTLLAVVVLGAGGYVGYTYYRKKTNKPLPSFGVTLKKNVSQGLSAMGSRFGLGQQQMQQQQARQQQLQQHKLAQEQAKASEKEKLLKAFDAGTAPVQSLPSNASQAGASARVQGPGAAVGRQAGDAARPAGSDTSGKTSADSQEPKDGDEEAWIDLSTMSLEKPLAKSSTTSSTKSSASSQSLGHPTQRPEKPKSSDDPFERLQSLMKGSTYSGAGKEAGQRGNQGLGQQPQHQRGQEPSLQESSLEKSTLKPGSASKGISSKAAGKTPASTPPNTPANSPQKSSPVDNDEDAPFSKLEKLLRQSSAHDAIATRSSATQPSTQPSRRASDASTSEDPFARLSSLLQRTSSSQQPSSDRKSSPEQGQASATGPSTKQSSSSKSKQ
ncbi:MAG: hypothetical protein QW594_00970, partial [Candidatus Woesearchaeota archaeon]